MKIDELTKLTGSIAGKQTGLGPAMHNAAYYHLNINSLYLALTVTDCKRAIQAIKALGFRGVAVSKPFKQEVIKYLDNLDQIAKEIGAVNTIINENGKLTGYNSDWIGAVSALEEKTSLKGKKVALIGAGGAARAIVYGLKKRKARVTVFNRTQETGKSLAKDFGQSFGGTPNDIPSEHDFEILVNATSVGYGDRRSSPVQRKTIFHKNMLVLDVVFSPLETAFLKLAKKQSCETVPGYRMLIYQALFQFHKFTGRHAPFQVMEKALKKHLI